MCLINSKEAEYENKQLKEQNLALQELVKEQDKRLMSKSAKI